MTETIGAPIPATRRRKTKTARTRAVGRAIACARAMAIACVCTLPWNDARGDTGPGLDVGARLDPANVQLLAVEFYASWCESCVAAVPEWKKLHEEYRNEGLRFVVVAVRDPKSGCADPGWTPDEIVCDANGELAERFNADRLPAAFLWDWTGNLLVNHGDVDTVEQVIREWREKTPVVAIEIGDVAAGPDLSVGGLYNLLRQELVHRGKLRVAPMEVEQRTVLTLRQVRAKSSCASHPVLTANSVLRASVRKTAERMRLQLNLLSAEQGCPVVATMTSWDPKKPEISATTGINELIAHLRPEVRYPWGAEARKESSTPLVVEAPPVAPRKVAEDGERAGVPRMVAEEDRVSPVVNDMVEVPAGEFIYGCSKEEDPHCSSTVPKSLSQ